MPDRTLERAGASLPDPGNAVRTHRSLPKTRRTCPSGACRAARRGPCHAGLVFRDPYLLDFLGLADTYSERDLETAILRELERFLLELEAGFAFIARQKRIIIDGEDYYIDLLFYHRGLRRLVAIDLKIGKFQAADKGQMELYLRWLDRYERRSEEEAPMGLILCAGKSAEHIELLQLGRSGIRVAEYLTELPPKVVLEERLKAAISVAREQLEMRYDINTVKSPKTGEE